MSLLEVRDLRVEARSEGGPLTLVDGVSFDIAARERVALVGESGSGKSVTARALLKLDEALRLSGSIRFDGLEITTMRETDLAAVRGRRVSMLFQDPLSALNPTRPIGDQVAEPLIVHGVGRREARRRAVAALDDLGIPDAARRARAFPHEFSGGMRQRVVLAMALVGEPDLLVADEPTTALDVRVQAQVLALLDRVAAERDLAVLMITHDVGVVAGFADRVLVMYSGRVAESSEVHGLFEEPAHPYTRGLLQTVPHLDTPPGRLVPLPGMPPSPAARPSGCAFHPRCPVAVDACRSTLPLLRPAGAAHEAACHLVEVAS